jgi:S1-C subfamily serine protease
MIDETKIMQYADGTLPEDEKETVKKAIESDPQLRKLLKDYQATGEMLFNLGKEIKSQPLPSSLQKKLKIINKERERSSDGIKSFIFFRIPKIAYAGIAATFAFILYSVFQTTAPLVVDNINDGSILRTGAILKKFEITESVSDPGEGMLNTEDFKIFYDEYLTLYNFEKTIDEKNSKNKFIKKIKKMTKAAFKGQDAKTIHAKWKNSVFWITNPTNDINDDEIMLGGGGIGSGSLIDKNGLILTNWHVIKNANQVWVYPYPKDPSKGLQMDKVTDAEKFLAIVVAKNKKTDLALVQITGFSKRITPVPLGIGDKIETGEKVFAIGHPAFYGWDITDGIVRGIVPNYEWNYGKPPKEGEKFDHTATVMRSSAEIEGGSSGGPLFNEKGRMIGINNMGEIGSNNINFAIVVKHAQELIKNKEQPGIKATATVEPLTEKILRQKYPNLWTDDYSQNGVIDTWYVDTNNNGIGDTIYTDDDEDGLIEAIYIDKDEDNSPEIRLFDTDLDGRPDEKLIDRDDQNDDVKWDAVAVDIDQDGTWDKVQDIPKS